MKRLQLTLCGVVLLALAGCGGDGAGGTATSEPAPQSSTPAQQGDGATTSGSVAQGKATISADGLLYVGADTAKVGDTISVSVTNEETGQVDVRLTDPSGKSVGHVQVRGGANVQISAIANTPGEWTVTFDEANVGDDLTKVITVS